MQGKFLQKDCTPIWSEDMTWPNDRKPYMQVAYNRIQDVYPLGTNISYPLFPGAFEDDFPFPQVRYVSSRER